MVRAKFRCLEITQRYSHTNADDSVSLTYRVKLAPVYGTQRNGKPASPENAAFYAATPSGQIELEMVSEATGQEFVPGQTYYIDFTPAPE